MSKGRNYRKKGERRAYLRKIMLPQASANMSIFKEFHGNPKYPNSHMEWLDHLFPTHQYTTEEIKAMADRTNPYPLGEVMLRRTQMRKDASPDRYIRISKTEEHCIHLHFSEDHKRWWFVYLSKTEERVSIVYASRDRAYQMKERITWKEINYL